MSLSALVEARGVSMEFPGVRALDGVDFDVKPGEVHALIGENGAGKSTLIKILSGEISGYGGEVRVDGAPRRMESPREAIEAGIAVIPQELQLVSSLSVAENIFLGREPRALLPGAARARLEAPRRDADIAPAELVGRLETGQRQLVAIARALSLDARLIIMDEPTTSLSAPEASRLERLIERLIGARCRDRLHLPQARRGRAPGRTGSRCSATGSASSRARRRASTRPRWCG